MCYVSVQCVSLLFAHIYADIINVPSTFTAGNAANAAPLPLIDEMDLSIQCNPMFMRSTVGKIVSNQAAATNTRLPLGLVCKPMAGDVGTENDGE